MFSALTSLPRYAKTLLLLLVDSLLGATALLATILARAGTIPNVAAVHVVILVLFAMVLVPFTAYLCGMYRSVIRFNTPRLPIKAASVGLLCGAAITGIGWTVGAPYKAMGLGAVFALMLFSILLLSRHVARWLLQPATDGLCVAVYGAGAAGRQLVALMQQSYTYKPVAFIDDDQALHGRMVEGLQVLASDDKKLARKLTDMSVREIFLAIPSVGATRRRQILERLGELPFHVRTVPNLDELAKGQPYDLADLREISPEDLLGRDPVQPVPGLLEKCVTARVVLVTGGGGSIGSELCRQVLALHPARLIVLEHGEFALYKVEQELQKLHMTLKSQSELVFALGSVTDRGMINGLFGQHQVDTVYHAAAYKHVPIVEGNALEGLRNNVLGTWYVAQAAARTGASHFILISSDKAVRPTNVMGATKRLAELVLQVQADRSPNTVFSMVRFGNVLASSGSVVPLFRAQIEAGGPITLTHPDVTRYFMTIPEAVQLVIQAGAMARGGEVFVLEMGDPVKIRDLALRMIRLSGRSVRDEHNPQGDIGIEVVGLRAGEKLFEELLIGGEAAGTAHPRIWQVREAGVDASAFERELAGLEQQIIQNPHAIDVLQMLTKWVTGYTRPASTRPPMLATPQSRRANKRDAAIIDTPAALGRSA